MKCKYLKIKLNHTIYCKKLNKEIQLKTCTNCKYFEFKNPPKYKYRIGTNKKNNRAKATDIQPKIKKIVWERDNHRCVVCGNTTNVMPNAHILSRAHGGLGIETNIVTLCTDLTPNKCHSKFDNGTKEERDFILSKIEKHMKNIYGDDWSIEKQKYTKK